MPMHSSDEEDEDFEYQSQVINCSDVFLPAISLTLDPRLHIIYTINTMAIHNPDLSLRIFEPIFKTDWIRLDACMIKSYPHDSVEAMCDTYIDIPICPDTRDAGGLGRIMKRIMELTNNNNPIENITFPFWMKEHICPVEIRFRYRFLIYFDLKLGSLVCRTKFRDLEIREIIDEPTIDNVDDLELMVTI